ncbi:MAG: hypothetical protein JNL66_09505 [Alphaproteobacteria bacterium]|nr:hypothetical protein [Alphaproteobacteria bacterium]
MPVRGNVEGTDEVFSGTATGRMSGAGSLQIRSSTGTTCTGRFAYIWDNYGRGNFTCSDGRSGPFDFYSTGVSGHGRGYLNGKRFTFDFGI